MKKLAYKVSGAGKAERVAKIKPGQATIASLLTIIEDAESDAVRSKARATLRRAVQRKFKRLYSEVKIRESLAEERAQDTHPQALERELPILFESRTGAIVAKVIAALAVEKSLTHSNASVRRAAFGFVFARAKARGYPIEQELRDASHAACYDRDRYIRRLGVYVLAAFSPTGETPRASTSNHTLRSMALSELESLRKTSNDSDIVTLVRRAIARPAFDSIRRLPNLKDALEGVLLNGDYSGIQAIENAKAKTAWKVLEGDIKLRGAMVELLDREGPFTREETRARVALRRVRDYH